MPAFQTSNFAFQGAGQFAFQTESLAPVPESKGYFGVSFRRRRRHEEEPIVEVPIAETIRNIITYGKPFAPEVSVTVTPAGEFEELVEIRTFGLSKRDRDAIIVAILASEL